MALLLGLVLVKLSFYAVGNFREIAVEKMKVKLLMAPHQWQNPLVEMQTRRLYFCTFV